MTDYVEVRRGAYHDSVSLMQVSRTVQQAPGMQAALIAMGTPLNVDVLAGMGLSAPASCGPNDLLVGLRAETDSGIAAGLAALEAALVALVERDQSAGGFGDRVPPRTTGSAAARSRGNLALISVPGPAAFVEAMDALDHGLSVMIFSDNVPIELEIRLKDVAAERDLLVMGPDCGTASVTGIGLGFANVVRSGAVGLVAASGTGAQQVMCLLDAAGVGISSCLGVGGRDLSARVAGRSTRQALAALDADPATELIVLISKPPAPGVSEELSAAVAGLATPVSLALLGAGRPDLTAVAERVVAAVGGAVPSWPVWEPAPEQGPRAGLLRGLFSGGTLCQEAMLLAADRLGPIASNIPLDPSQELGPDLHSDGHLMIDFGEDRLTAGRPHPMIDPSLRLDRLAVEAADPRTAVILLDVVLGHGAHPDPAADLAPAIRAAIAGAAAPAVVVSLCGTAGDPQGLERQAGALQAAGAAVFLSNAQAARRAVSLIRPVPA